MFSEAILRGCSTCWRCGAFKNSEALETIDVMKTSTVHFAVSPYELSLRLSASFCHKNFLPAVNSCSKRSNSVEQSSWKASSRSAGQQYYLPLRNKKIRYHIHSSPSQIFVMSLMNLVYILIIFVRSIFKVSVPSMLSSLKWLFSFRLLFFRIYHGCRAEDELQAEISSFWNIVQFVIKKRNANCYF